MLSLSLIFVTPLIMTAMPNSGTTEGQLLSSPDPSTEQDHGGSVKPYAGGLAVYRGPGRAGRMTPGMVTWAPISDNAVQATVYLADPKVTVTLTFSKNNEPGLNASYLIQIQIVGTFDEGLVRAVPKVSAKRSRLEDGRELAGMAVRVTSDLFWYVLSGETGQDDHNKELLRTVSWIELTLSLGGTMESQLVFETNALGAKLLHNLVIVSHKPTGL